ncbi:MAG: beta-galactosidase [Clostridia bacterium]|nr:beta-galactosidase [Clostridia bacterium]
MRYTFTRVPPAPFLRGHLRLGGANPSGERIDVTSRSLERGRRPWLPVMGEYHFVRDRAENWYTELCKMKAGGVTVISTYLFWICHEEEEGVFDFTGDRDVRRFVLEAQRAGLDVLARIGPWAHGECRSGGFPDWLLEKGFRLRHNDPGYLAKVRIWYSRLYEQLRGLLYRDGGPVIGVQLDNELVDDAEHLLTLKTLAREAGFDVPLYTVTGWNSRYGAKIPVDEVLPVFGAYPDAPWAEGTSPLPLSPHYVFDARRNDSAVGVDVIRDTDESGWRLPYERYPFATCELGSGLMPTHHRRPLVSGMDTYALSLVKLGSGNNLVGYYMYHGGTNKLGRFSTLNESRATGYPNDYPVLNYDFHTALTQYGEARSQYRLLNLLHLFLAEWGGELALMDFLPQASPPAPDDLSSLRLCLRARGDRGFVFVNHHQRGARLADVPGAVIDTGGLVFPPIDVRGDVSFFFPYNMPLGGETLACATAQPLTRSGGTWFFAAVEGIPPVFQLEGRPPVTARPGEILTLGTARVVTLSWQEALYLRRLSGQIFVGEGVDLYEEDGVVTAIQPGSFAFRRWTGDGFVREERFRPFDPARLTMTPVPAPFDPPYPDELAIGGPRKLSWKKLEVSSPEGFVEISEPCDAAQIYADGLLTADQFFTGEPWRIPASLLFGHECYLVCSELKDDCLFEDGFRPLSAAPD